MPYKGSKSSIAEWVIEQLPEADIFIDLFAGGCAITHAAMLSGKYKKIICNDISGTPYIFKQAIDGDFDGLFSVPNKEGFFISDDVALKLLYSFGNDQSSYLWGERYEALKVPATKMLTAPSLHERRIHYRTFMKELNKYIRDVLEENNKLLERPHELQGLEALERLNNLSRLQGLEALEVMVSDYRNVNLPDNAVVYADPPYRNTGEHYGGFDFDAFDKWLSEVKHPVYISEYDTPEGCVCIAEKERSDHMSAYGSNKKIEKIFIQERFKNKQKQVKINTK